VTQPNAADAAGADLGASQAQLIGDSLRAVRREAQGVIEDLLFDLGRHAIWMRITRPAFLLDQCSDAADLKGPPDLVEGVAVVAHQLAGLRYVAEFLGQLQQGEFSLGTLRERSYLGTPDSSRCGSHESTPETRVAAPGIYSVGCRAGISQLSENNKNSSRRRCASPESRPIGIGGFLADSADNSLALPLVIVLMTSEHFAKGLTERLSGQVGRREVVRSIAFPRRCAEQLLDRPD